MIEKDIERLLKTKVEKEIPGARCLKFVSPGCNGVPDRIILLPGGAVVFAELKRPGERPRQRQLFIHERLRDLGFTVAGCVDSLKAVDVVVEICRLRWMMATRTENLSWDCYGSTGWMPVKPNRGEGDAG